MSEGVFFCSIFRFSSFYFSQVAKEIRKWNTNEAVQDPDIPVKKLKGNAEYFAEYICYNLTK